MNNSEPKMTENEIRLDKEISELKSALRDSRKRLEDKARALEFADLMSTTAPSEQLDVAIGFASDLPPEDVFPAEVLQLWAETNGYAPEA